MSTHDEIRLAERIERTAWIDQLAAAPRALAEALGLHTEELGGATLLISQRLPLTLFNRAMGLGIDEPADERAIDAIERAYAARGVSRYWVHTTPVSEPSRALVDWLGAHGFTRPPRSHWAKMLRDVSPLGAVRSQLVVREAHPAERASLSRVIAAAHGMPAPIAAWIEAIAGRERWTLFGVWSPAAEPIAAGLVFVDGKRAWLGLAGTLAAERRRGAQGLLLRARIERAAELGCEVVGTETGEPIAGEHNPSLANMERVGFRKVCSRANHERVLG